MTIKKNDTVVIIAGKDNRINPFQGSSNRGRCQYAGKTQKGDCKSPAGWNHPHARTDTRFQRDAV